MGMANEWGPGTLLAGRYRILGVARAGGFGTVLEALDSNLRTKVWVSALSEGQSDSHAAAEEAARLAATLDHPHVLGIDEVGDDEGTLYLRTRIVEGPNLEERLQAEEAPTAGETARYLLQIADALAAIHAAGLCHGDLQAGCILFDQTGGLLVTDPAVGAAAGGWNWRAKGGERGDLLALGVLGHRLLGGQSPGEPLPDEAPEPQRSLVTALLNKSAAAPSAQEVADRLREVAAPPPGKSRSPVVLGAVAVIVLVGAALYFLDNRGAKKEAEDNISMLLAEQRFDETVEELRQRRAEHPDDASLKPLLAGALRARAAQLATDEKWWQAQPLAEEADALHPSPEGATLLGTLRGRAQQRLDAIEIAMPALTNDPTVRIDLAGVPMEFVRVGDFAAKIDDGQAVLRLEIEDGKSVYTVQIRDKAGNERSGQIEFVLDTTPPKVEVLEPAEGAVFSNQTVSVRIRIRDAHPMAWGEMYWGPADQKEGDVWYEGAAKKVGLTNGEATVDLTVEDGEHAIAVHAADRAGNKQTAERRFRVDSTAPRLSVATHRIVSKDGRGEITGTLTPPVTKLTIGGKPVEFPGGEFSVPVATDSTTTVEIVATSPAGVIVRETVEVRRDDVAPELSIAYPVQDEKGVILYGAAEIRNGKIYIPLIVSDRSNLTYKPSAGSVDEGVWTLPAPGGKRTDRIEATDEAGNTAVLELKSEGSGKEPALVVSCPLSSPTNAREAVIEIESDADLTFQGANINPGLLRHPLNEGRNDLEVRAVDRYGNAKSWGLRLEVDRTAPEITLADGTSRHVGRQRIVFEGNEPLKSLRVGARELEPEGKLAVMIDDVREGRRKLPVIAADLAGNTIETSFDLVAHNHVLALDGESSVKVELKEPLKRFTLECWAKGADSELPMALAGQAEGGAFGLLWSSTKWTRPSGVVVLEGIGYLRVPSKRAPPANAWTHFALSYDGKTVRYFVNGHLVAEEVRNGALRPAALPLYLGAMPGDGEPVHRPFRGELDEVRLSDVARYAADFKPARAFMRDQKTVALFHFDTDTEDVFLDDSGREHVGAPVGTPGLRKSTR